MDGHLEEALVDDTNEFVLNILVQYIEQLFLEQ